MNTILSRNVHHFHRVIHTTPEEFCRKHDLSILTVAAHRSGYVFVRIDAGRGDWTMTITRNIKIDDLAAFMLTMCNINERLGEYK